MTTPRVTVPVEPTEAMMNACPSSFSPSFAAIWPKVCRDIYQAMLSAAPAPEGGAEKAREIASSAAEAFQRLMVSTKFDRETRELWAGAYNDMVAIYSALATREEAPAEAGAAIERLTKLTEINGSCPGWIVVNQNDLRVALPALRAHPQAPTASFMAKAKHLLDLAEKAEEAALDGDEGCVWPVEALRAAYDNLAQPPAREDAQPVAWRWKAPSKWKASTDPNDAEFVRNAGVAVQPLYTHPAPDALREDPQAWGMLADLVSWFTKPVQGQNGMVWVIPAGDQGADDAVNAALSALQAEQKGGA